MSDYGEVIGPGSVRFRRVLPGPIERVWQYLTDSDLRGSWLASGPMQSHAGGTVTLLFRHQDLTAHDEAIPEKYRSMENGVTSVYRVTEWEPPRRLAYTWGTHSEVHFELEPKGRDVLLTLTHRRLAQRTDMINVSGGWHAHLDVLAEVLRGESPAPFWSRLESYEREYQERVR